MTLRQLDNSLKALSPRQWQRPNVGWVRTIRKTLGMTIKQLAKRLGVDSSRVVRIEVDEIKDSVTLRSLATVADALDCRLVYTFVPNAKDFTTLVEQQAHKTARKQVGTVNHTMQLESQGLDPSEIKAQEKFVADELLRRSWKYLWEDDEV